MAIFTSAFLGEVRIPKNTLHEYLIAFKNKCQADILSWLDNWTRTKRSQGLEDWIWLVTSKLAKELGYCKDTIFRHLDKLLNAGVIDRRKANRWACDQAYEYRIVPEKLAAFVKADFQHLYVLHSDQGQPECSTSIVQNQTTYINTVLDPSSNHTQSSDVEEKEETDHEETDGCEETDFELSAKKMRDGGRNPSPRHSRINLTVNQDLLHQSNISNTRSNLFFQASSHKEDNQHKRFGYKEEKIREALRDIRALSPEFQINLNVQSAITSNWASFPAVLSYLKTAIRTWKVRPDFNWTGLLVKTLKCGVPGEALPPKPKEYPSPSLDHLEVLGTLGELIHTRLDEPGYPEVLAVAIEGRVTPWWVALGLGDPSIGM